MTLKSTHSSRCCRKQKRGTRGPLPKESARRRSQSEAHPPRPRFSCPCQCAPQFCAMRYESHSRKLCSKYEKITTEVTRAGGASLSRSLHTHTPLAPMFYSVICSLSSAWRSPAPCVRFAAERRERLKKHARRCTVERVCAKKTKQTAFQPSESILVLLAPSRGCVLQLRGNPVHGTIPRRPDLAAS